MELPYRSELNEAVMKLAAFAGPNAALEQAVGTLGGESELLVVGSGCSLGVARLFAQYLQETLLRSTHVVTPLEAVRRVGVVDTVVFVSSNGCHPHILAAAGRISGDTKAVVITVNSKTPLVRLLSERTANLITITPRLAPLEGGFIPVEKCLAMMGAAFGPALLEAAKGLSTQWDEVAQRVRTVESALVRACVLHILHAADEVAAAFDLETRLLESGVLIPTVADIWNFVHGRFNALGLEPGGVVVSFESAGTGKLVAPIISVIAQNTNVIRICGRGVGTIAGINCYLQALQLVACLGDVKGIDAAHPCGPTWGRLIYGNVVSAG